MLPIINNWTIPGIQLNDNFLFCVLYIRGFKNMPPELLCSFHLFKHHSSFSIYFQITIFSDSTKFSLLLIWRIIQIYQYLTIVAGMARISCTNYQSGMLTSLDMYWFTYRTVLVYIDYFGLCQKFGLVNPIQPSTNLAFFLLASSSSSSFLVSPATPQPTWQPFLPFVFFRSMSDG